MPLIMDDEDQYMEELFGDAEQVHVPITATPPAVKGLAERLDELAGTGCCQKISWSRFGSIAAVPSDGHGVEIFNYVRDAPRGWHLSKPIAAPFGPSGIDVNPVVHVSWSHMGNTLAAVDSHGCISIYVTGYVQGNVSLRRQNFALEPDDDMHTLVGLHWLPVHPQESMFNVHWAATQSGNEWNHRTTQFLTPGPRNPIDGKTALLTLSRGGLLRLLYEQADGSWREVSTELDPSPTQIDATFTHASFTYFKDDSLALATYDVSGRLRVYQVNINWGQPNQKEGQNAQPQFNPSLQVKALKTVQFGTPNQSIVEDPTLSSILDVSALQLTHFEILPPPAEHGNSGDSSVIISAIFTAIPSQATNPLDAAAHYNPPFSIISRWKVVRDFQHDLSSCFEQLAAKKKSTASVGARKSPQLERLPDIQLHSTVTSVTPTRNGTLLAFRLSDGTIQHRYLDSLEIVPIDSNQHEVQSMPQSGFTFPAIESASQVTFSPSHCIMAIRKDDGIVEAKPIEYSQGSLADLREEDGNLGPIISLLAIQLSNSIYQYRWSDDLTSLLSKKLDQDFYSRVIYQTVRFLHVEVDFVTEEGQRAFSNYLRNQSIYKVLSMQNVLGTNVKGTRNLQAKFAWIALNLRLCCYVLGNVLRHNEALRPDSATALAGLVRYSTDFLVYILQELFDMFYKIRRKEGDRDFIQSLLYKENSPAFVLILASFTRIQLRMLCQPLRAGQVHAMNGIKTATNPEHKACYQKFAQGYQSSPLGNTKAFEQFLMEADNCVREAYKQAKFDDHQRKAAERDLFWKCELPEVLMPAVKQILTTKVRALMEASDPGKIHVHDISWLNFTDKRTKAGNERIFVDVIRKVQLNPSTRLRRCPRCASVMEDLTQQQLGSQQAWLVQAQKNCVCWSSWVPAEPPQHQHAGTSGVVRF